MRVMTPRLMALMWLPLLLVVLSGCAQMPRPSVVGEQERILIPDPPQRLANGSIYQPQRGIRPLFEDRRPRMPGDILTIILDEEVSATKTAQSSASRNGSANLNMGQLPLPLTERIAELEELGFDVSGGSDFSGGGDASASNTFTGTITVSVNEVMPNGNLRVRGEKQIAINQGVEFIRFSGVVNPRTISGQNTVPSNTVADARIEYVGDGYISEAQHMGWMQRFFLNVSPF